LDEPRHRACGRKRRCNKYYYGKPCRRNKDKALTKTGYEQHYPYITHKYWGAAGNY
jgi:hypothetical protein